MSRGDSTSETDAHREAVIRLAAACQTLARALQSCADAQRAAVASTSRDLQLAARQFQLQAAAPRIERL
jgi:hypothetical protein